MSDSQDSDENPYSDSDHDDESHNSSSDEAIGNGLFDLEASEDDSDAAYDGQNGSDYEDGDTLESFPKFMKLPLELREMVWKAFCPDLTAGGRVFQIRLMDELRPILGPGPVLEDQTAPMRTLLAVDRQARDMGLKSSPHTFSLSGGEIIRYHEGNDIIHIEPLPGDGDYDIRRVARELGGSPQNVAFPLFWPGSDMVGFCNLVPAVRRIFIMLDENELLDIPIKDYSWAVSENIHHYQSETEEDGEAGLVTTVQQLFCWPDLDKHREFAEQIVDLGDCGRSARLRDCLGSFRATLNGPLENTEDISMNHVREVWPMIHFHGDAGLKLFNDMKAWDRPFDEWEAESSYSEDTEDEYDSEGIDDDSIHDHLSTDDEDDLPGQVLTTSSPGQGTLGRLLDSSSETNDHLAAQFSSDEDDEGGNEEGHAEESGSDHDEEGSRERASRPKRRVVTSESEDESATETEEPRPAPTRRGRAVLADSDDENDEEDEEQGGANPQPVLPAGRNRRTDGVPSESDSSSSSNSEHEANMRQPSRTTLKRRARALQVDSDDDDDESEPEGVAADPQKTSSSNEEEDTSEESSSDEDDEPAPPKRMSLAQRLMMEAQRERSGHLDDGDSDADGNDHGAAFDDEGDGDGIAGEYSSEDRESEEEF